MTDTTFFNPNDFVELAECPSCGTVLHDRDINESFQIRQFECICPACGKEFEITRTVKGRIDYSR